MNICQKYRHNNVHTIIRFILALIASIILLFVILVAMVMVLDEGEHEPRPPDYYVELDIADPAIDPVEPDIEKPAIEPTL